MSKNNKPTKKNNFNKPRAAGNTGASGASNNGSNIEAELPGKSTHRFTPISTMPRSKRERNTTLTLEYMQAETTTQRNSELERAMKQARIRANQAGGKKKRKTSKKRKTRKRKLSSRKSRKYIKH